MLRISFTSDQASKIYDNGKLLSYQTPGSSGFDLRALYVIDEDGNKHDLAVEPYNFLSGARVKIGTGLRFAIDQEYEIQVRSRSGLAAKNGVFVLNSPGTIDSDYRGEIVSIMLNTGKSELIVNLGDRICQAVVCPVIKPEFKFVEELGDTERGAGGFGSTGSK